jgi:uncharacterized protein
MQPKKTSFTPFLVILFFFVALFTYIKLAGPIPFSVNSRVTNEIDNFSVTGEGEVSIKPDIAYLSVGFRQTGSTVSQVQSQANQVMNNVTQRLKQLGINTDKDIKTVAYSINPNYDWQDRNRRIVGYEAYTSLRITIRDIEQVNQVVDETVAGGANIMNGLSFDVEDKEQAIDQARQEAVAQAKKKAQLAANTAGFKLGRIIGYRESTGDDYSRPVYDRAYSMAESSVPETEIHTGTTDVKISVTMTYAIE